MDVDKIRVFDQNMNLVDVVGMVSTTATIGMMLAGLPLCTKMVREGTQNVQLFPFIAFFVNCMLWSEYGLLRHDLAIIVVNVTGCTLEGLYIFLFFKCTKNKMMVVQMTCGALLVMFPALIYSKFLSPSITRAVSVLGKLCICASIVTFGSPLSSITRVIKTRSSESMSFLWSFVASVAAFQWTVYGYLRRDSNLIIPNGIGLVLGLVQLALIFKYKPKAVKKSSDVRGCPPDGSSLI